MNTIEKLLISCFFLLVTLTSLQGQSPAQAKINQLNNYLKTMERLETKPNWESKAYQLRYADYLGRMEKTIEAIAEKDSTYDLATARSKMALYQQNLAVNSIENKEVKHDAYPERNKLVQEPLDAEEKAEKERIAAMKKEMEDKIAAQNAAGAAAWQDLHRTSMAAQLEAEKNREKDKAAYERLSREMESRTDGILLKTPCGRAMEYCIVDSRGQVCTEIGGSTTEFRKCTFPVKVYLAAGGRKTTFIANVTQAGTPIRLCE